MGLRLSVATKIFLGFAVVIVAFGATSVFTLYRMGSLRQSVTVLWKELFPMSNQQLRGLSRQLKSAEELLALKRANDPQWLQQVLPSLEPFSGPQGFSRLAERLEIVAASGDIDDQDAAELARLASSFRRFVEGADLVDVMGETLVELVPPDEPPPNNAELFDRLVRRTLKKAAEGELGPTSPEARATARVIRRINREVNDAIRALAAPIQAIDRRISENERGYTIAVIVIASGALAVSILMLIVAQLTLSPIRRLGEGARRIAAGDYAHRVTVKSKDELGALAAEFNTMAQALEVRDKALADKQAELLHAERLAVIGKLAAQITHEVRNPLSSIGLNAELLEDELDDLPDPAPARRAMRAIADEVQRLKNITEEYLQFARLPRPERAPVDVGALVQSLLAFLEREVAQAKVTLVADGVRAFAEGGPAPILCDAAQVRQALLNVAKNALEALRGQPEPRVITVALSAEPDGGVAIRVEDNGPGIAPDVRDRLFEPFVTGKPHGTGLGLALVREILTEHGGSARAESPLAQGAGTAVVLVLPGPAVPF
ncbi:MAG: HAMP domain-containing protein [Deltaproteobacteria bacterium]|nr:HAMP domain-containing protein [Deltaproteobacteria bacterium]